MTLAPLREAADSMAKASTPEPFSSSRTSNWVARAGGLPAYVQHIAHDLMEKRGKSESNAIQMAIGIVKRWCRGGGNVDANTKAAACKAASEWEAKKAGSHAVQHSDVAKWRVPLLADELAVRDAAIERVAIMEQRFGGSDGLIAILATQGVLEEAESTFAPTLKRTASASMEAERHEAIDGGQTVGYIARRRGGIGADRGDSYHAHAVNGERVTDYPGERSRQGAVDALRRHLEEAPARVRRMGSKHLVASVSGYGPSTYKEFPSEGAARYAAGLPAAPTGPERDSKIAALGEQLRFDLMTLSGLEIPPLRAVQEARRRDPFDLVESFSAGELRDFHGRWRRGGAHVARLTPSSVPGRSTRAGRPKSDAQRRYEGGVTRAHAKARAAHAAKPAIAKATDKKPEKAFAASIGEEHNGPGAKATTARMLKQPHMDAGALERAVRAGKAIDTEQAHRTGPGGAFSEERQRLHEQIISNLLQGAGVHEGSARAIFTAGGGASGKSSVLTSQVDVPHDAVIVNPDVVREMLPEYKALKAAGREDAASLTHEESSLISKRVMRIALARQHHVLVDSVGDSGPGKFAGKVKAAQDAGHKVSVHYVTIPISEALKRADERGRKSGRFVDHATLREAHVGVSARFPEVAKIKGIHLQVFSNMDSPKLIAERKLGSDKLSIGDRREYEAFLRKAEEAM